MKYKATNSKENVTQAELLERLYSRNSKFDRIFEEELMRRKNAEIRSSSEVTVSAFNVSK